MWTMKRNSNKTLIEWWGLEAADVHICGVRVENSNSRGATADPLCQLFTKRTANICWSVSLWLTDAWSFPGSPLSLTFPLSLSLCCLRSTSCHIFTLWELAAFMYKIMFMLFRTQKRHSLGDYFCSYSLKSTNGNLKRSNHFDESVQQGGLSPPPGWDNQYNEWVLRLTLLPNVAFLCFFLMLKLKTAFWQEMIFWNRERRNVSSTIFSECKNSLLEPF